MTWAMALASLGHDLTEAPDDESTSNKDAPTGLQVLLCARPALFRTKFVERRGDEKNSAQPLLSGP